MRSGPPTTRPGRNPARSGAASTTTARREWASRSRRVRTGGVRGEDRLADGHRADIGDWGENDAALLPSLTRGLGEWVPDLRVEVIPGAGHWVPYEKPERINSLIREFID